MEQFADVTALGLVALMIVLLFRLGSQLISTMSSEQQQNRVLLQEQLLLLQSCLDKLTAIKESLHNNDL